MTNLTIEKSATNGAYTVKENGKHIGLLIKDPKWQYHNAPNGVWLDGDQMIQLGQKIKQLNYQDFLDDNDLHIGEDDFLHMYVCNECGSSTRIENKLHTIPHTSKCSHYIMSQADALSGKIPGVTCG